MCVCLNLLCSISVWLLLQLHLSCFVLSFRVQGVFPQQMFPGRQGVPAMPAPGREAGKDGTQEHGGAGG